MSRQVTVVKVIANPATLMTRGINRNLTRKKIMDHRVVIPHRVIMDQVMEVIMGVMEVTMGVIQAVITQVTITRAALHQIKMPKDA